MEEEPKEQVQEEAAVEVTKEEKKDAVGATNEQIITKTAISLGISLLMVLVGLMLGSITTTLFGKWVDLGLGLLWANQMVLVFVFLLEDLHGTRKRRMDELDALEIILTGCQVLPWLMALSSPYSYAKFTQMLLVQSALKFAYMKCFGKVVEIAL
ncbi:hypothetical protein BASA81_001149 [Batrachochytrium salamandrivorans]|nr:hypothetical protein BASA81_001149 [Batrachochytrium salamandrivorans]